MLSRSDLRKIAVGRLRDSEALLKMKRYDAAIYLCGYGVYDSVCESNSGCLMIDVNKLILLKREIESERGPISLFGLFRRENSAGYWELVIAAPWTSTDSWESLTYLSQKVSARLKKSEIMLLSRIEIIDDDNPWLDEALRALDVDDHLTMVRNVDLFGHEMKQAYVVQAKRLPKLAAK